MEDAGSRQQTDDILVTGRGVLPDGSPAAGAQVFVYGGREDSDDTIVTADDGGRFVITAPRWVEHFVDPAIESGPDFDPLGWNSVLGVALEAAVSASVAIRPWEGRLDLGDVQLQLGRRLSIEVRDADDGVVAGTECFVAGRGSDGARGRLETGCPRRVFTDDRGIAAGFVFAPGAAYAELSVSPPADEDASFTTRVDWEVGLGELQRVLVRLPPRRRVRGRVTREDGSPVANCGVSVDSTRPVVPTDASGRFDALFSWGPGSFLRGYAGDEFVDGLAQPWWRHDWATPLDDGEGPIDVGRMIVRDRVQLRVRVEAHGWRVSNGLIALRGHGSNSLSGRSPGQGAWRVWDALPPRTYELSAQGFVSFQDCESDSCPSRRLVAFGGAVVELDRDLDQVIELTTGAQLHLHLFAEGRPVEVDECVVSVDDAKSFRAPLERGCTTCSVAPGTHTLRVDVAGYRTVELAGVEVRSDRAVCRAVELRRAVET